MDIYGVSDFSENFILANKALQESIAWATHREWDKAVRALDDALAFAKGYRAGLLRQRETESTPGQA